MPIPDYQSLMLPVLQASSDGEIRIGDAVDKLAHDLGLSMDDRARLLPSGKQTIFANRAHWAKTYLTKAGLLESTRRGHFRITPAGKAIIDENPARIDNSFLTRFEAFRRFQEKSAQSAVQHGISAEPVAASQTETPDEVMRGPASSRCIAVSGTSRPHPRSPARLFRASHCQPATQHGLWRLGCRCRSCHRPKRR